MTAAAWRIGFLGILCVLVCQAENWPAFRGPRGDGTSLESFGGGWSLLWKTPLPGPGHSSPIVWQDRIVLTAFERETSLWRALLGSRGRLLVLCFDRRSGELRWEYEVEADEIENVTSVNQPASPTPVTDGASLFVYFGSVGLLALDFDGNLLWEHRLGPFPHHMGVGSSPVLYEDRLLLNVETDGPSFLLAVDKASGRRIWQVPRKTLQAGYSTPVVWNRQIVVSGHKTVIAYSPDDGRELWKVGGLSDYVVPTPVKGNDLLYVTSSGPGGNIVMALETDGTVSWRATRGASYIASPVLVADLLFTVNHGAIVSCLNAFTGSLVWQQRVGSPTSYFPSQNRAS